MKLEIEKGIPLPSKKTIRGRNKQLKYPFDDMDIGDSFQVIFHPDYFKDRLSMIRTVDMAKARFYKKTGKKFTSRSNDKGLRVWRVSNA